MSACAMENGDPAHLHKCSCDDNEEAAAAAPSNRSVSPTCSFQKEQRKSKISLTSLGWNLRRGRSVNLTSKRSKKSSNPSSTLFGSQSKLLVLLFILNLFEFEFDSVVFSNRICTSVNQQLFSLIEINVKLSNYTLYYLVPFYCSVKFDFFFFTELTGIFALMLFF